MYPARALQASNDSCPPSHSDLAQFQAGEKQKKRGNGRETPLYYPVLRDNSKKKETNRGKKTGLYPPPNHADYTTSSSEHVLNALPHLCICNPLNKKKTRLSTAANGTDKEKHPGYLIRSLGINNLIPSSITSFHYCSLSNLSGKPSKIKIPKNKKGKEKKPISNDSGAHKPVPVRCEISFELLPCCFLIACLSLYLSVYVCVFFSPLNFQRHLS